MSKKKYTDVPRLLTTALVFLFFTSCAAARIQMPSAPEYGAIPTGQKKDLTFVLNRFKIEGRTSKDSAKRVRSFRKAFLEHIDALSCFSRVIDGTERKTGYDSRSAVMVDVTVNLDNTRKTHWILAFPAVYPLIGMWPLVPTFGETDIRISARAKSANGITMWSKTSRRKRNFKMTFYGWYNTTPIEKAFKIATDRALKEILFDFRSHIPKIAKILTQQPTSVAKVEAPRAEPPISIKISDKQKAIPIEDRPVVAVFDIEDTRGPEERLSPNVRSDLTNYLTSLLAGTKRFTTVPRSDLRKVLAEQKAETYQSCYDESCQIEVGKEVAAGKSLATKLNRLGKKCVVTLTLFDLRKSITEDSVNTRGGCSTDNLTEAFERLVPKLGASV